MTTSPVGSLDATDQPQDVGPSADSGPAAPAAPESAPSGGSGRVTTLRLPFLTATFTRPSGMAGEPAGSGRPSAFAEPSGSSGPTSRGGEAGWASPSRLAFVGGAVALAALEVVEWPVTALVVAGSWLAGRSGTARSGPPTAHTPVGPPAGPAAPAAPEAAVGGPVRG